MRLCTRDVNAQGRLSKSPCIPLSQVDVGLLCTSLEAWPPLLPSFSREAVEAMNRFVQGFICKRIEYRCGQLSAEDYEDAFLPRWVRMAEHRTDLMEDFFAQHGSRLSEETFRDLFGAFEKMQSALRDARQEPGGGVEGRHDKRITFARPVAHRLIRRSRDRFSLRSVADVDEGAELSHPSPSPCPSSAADAWRGSLHLGSSSPIPGGAVLSVSSVTDVADADDVRTFVLPVEESTDGDHFTGRASGVYYGDLLRSAGSSARSSGKGGHAAAATSFALAEGRDSLENDAGFAEAVLQAYSGPVRRATTWRRLWIRCFYHCILPAAVVVSLAAYYWDTLQLYLRL
ncbi:conserved hypothetical protein [Leishmania mexicana MHOM/GT/2001/U1103]|uniref:Uncharacterized protein n=1 Tax=Leishmania mexicana (strain MHOM/GT/2001/U1103) TaxID=929439 RepID=E9B2F0_LEIMU|nr:conserved hypothetical protein [Leishmania mexicana MHOM/GT/2001/U1103]CBZ29413.1 conserved hypothetical protein [Leishmania mexicana MHOM/GT/2001/U1103]